MGSMRARVERAVRGVTAAAFATFVALVSHVAGGGAVPGWLGIVVPFMLGLPVCLVAAGRKPSIPRLAVSTAVSQVLFHVLFSLGTPSAGVQLIQSPGASHHGSMTMVVTDPAGMAGHDHIGAAMWTGHAVAAALTILALYFGERAYFATLLVAERVQSWWGRIWRPLHLRLGSPRPASMPAVEPRVVRPLGWHTSTLRRRGPPLLVA